MEITAAQVQTLRAKTGAGIKDCKKALVETNGDEPKAIEWLRQKGLASAVKKASRTAAEGVVRSYIHFGNRVGVLVEVNCETDFVARREELIDLADNVARQVAAYQQVEYVSMADIPPDVVAKEREIESGKDDLANKPPQIREKIVEGRIEKRLKEMCLLDQPYIKDDSKTVDELVKETAARLSENIKVGRFVRFIVGETQEKATETPEAAPAVESPIAEDPASKVEAVMAAADPAPAVAEPVAEPAVEAAPPVAEAVTEAPEAPAKGKKKKK
ncbi:MAG TPA: translation elongation factor Ts [Cyanobacteria bacterium UBA8156]|jgi:elongation factor Ts|nr:translation elongation factor Ts [Cyanobacteria bacterium UBA8156]